MNHLLRAVVWLLALSGAIIWTYALYEALVVREVGR